MAAQPADQTINVRGVIDALRGVSNDPSAIGLGVYSACLMLQTHLPYKEAIEKGCSNGMLRAHLLKNANTQTRAISGILATSDFSDEELREFLVMGAFGQNSGRLGGAGTTPDCICELAIRVLEIKDGDKVADQCCGFGRFLINVSRISKAKLYGTEINAQSAMVAIAALDLVGADAEVTVGDALSDPGDNKFDKVLSNFPFGMRTAFMNGTGKYYEVVKSGRGGIGRPLNADWVFALAAYDSLSEGGRAFCIMTDGSLSNGSDKKARRFFVDNGMIQAIISLPGGLFQGTSISTTAVVLGKNQGAIRMVDAKDLSVPGRRWDSMGKDEIDEVMHRLAMDGDFSKSIGREAIRDADFNLSVPRYLGREVELVNPTALGDIVLSIERGAAYRAAELDGMTTLESTDCCYLQLGDISDGIISGDLAHLTKLESKTEKQWLRTGDLVVSKNGAPFKIAVADVPEGKRVLANGNLYIVRLDPEKADPYYVAAFLVSEDGREIMNREVVGTTIPNLPQANLRRVQIALPPLEEQKRIGSLYRARLDEIEMLRIELDKARIAANEVYTEAIAW